MGDVGVDVVGDVGGDVGVDVVGIVGGAVVVICLTSPQLLATEGQSFNLVYKFKLNQDD